MKPSRAALGIAVVLFAFLVAPSHASFVVSPMEHHLKVEPGRGERVTVVLRNTGQSPLTIKLYLSDSRFAPGGEEEDLPAGTTFRSCARWMDLEDQLIELQPGETRPASFLMAVPDTARGSYWTKLFLEEISTPEPREQRVRGRSYQVFIKQRMGVRIFQEVPGTVKAEALVSLVRVDETPQGSRQILTRVVNSGNALLDCRGRVELRNSRGDVAETLTCGTEGTFWVFPGAYRDMTVTSRGDLPPDTYTAVAIVDFGGDHLVAGEEVFRILGDGSLTGASPGARK